MEDIEKQIEATKKLIQEQQDSEKKQLLTEYQTILEKAKKLNLIDDEIKKVGIGARGCY